MRSLLILLCAALLASCSAERQAQKKVAWLVSHDMMDDACARLYPVQDSIVVRDSVSYDTVLQETDVYIRDTQFVEREGRVEVIYREKKCPPHQVVTKTAIQERFIYRTNTAEEERLKGQILTRENTIKQKDALIVAKDKKIDQREWWKMACLITWAVIGLGVVFRLFILKRPI